MSTDEMIGRAAFSILVEASGERRRELLKTYVKEFADLPEAECSDADQAVRIAAMLRELFTAPAGRW